MRFAFFLLAFVLTSSCGSKKETLYIFSWANYIKPELIERFEKEHNCQVIIDNFESNESMFAKMKLGASRYDIVVPSNYYLERMQKQKMLQPINKKALSNYHFLSKKILKEIDKECRDYGVAYMIAPTVIAYRNDKLQRDTFGWDIFLNSSLRGRMTMLNDLREVLGAALIVQGYSVNSQNPNEIQKAKERVLLWKKNLAKFESEQYKNGIASGEYIIVQGFGDDISQVMAETAAVSYVYPQEGTMCSIDFLAIPRKAQNVALAHDFIDFLLDPEVSRENMEETRHLSPNTLALKMVDHDLQTQYRLFIEALESGNIELLHDLGIDGMLYTKAWQEIKSR